jgi:hypothetical protein
MKKLNLLRSVEATTDDNASFPVVDYDDVSWHVMPAVRSTPGHKIRGRQYRKAAEDACIS